MRYKDSSEYRSRNWYDEPLDMNRLGKGRKGPCPCGSGKKYKKCHMGK